MNTNKLMWAVVCSAITIGLWQALGPDKKQSTLKDQDLAQVQAQVDSQVPRDGGVAQGGGGPQDPPPPSTPGGSDDKAQIPSFDDRDVPRRDDFEREYRHADVKELRRALRDSQKKVAEAQWVEKANQNQLTNEDKALLMAEIRRQGVLSLKLARLGLARLNERFR